MSNMQVWWVPQIPMKPFIVPVGSIEEAHLLVETLAAYDAFQFQNRIKPDYCNAGGLQVLEDGEWLNWFDEETGYDFDEWRRNHFSNLYAEISKASGMRRG